MRPIPLLVLTLGLAPASTALALIGGGPTGDQIHTDIHTGPPERLHVDHGHIQNAMSRDNMAWQNFKADHPQWQVRWDESTGTPLRIYGDGLDMGRVDTDDEALRSAKLFLREVVELANIRPHEMRVKVNEARDDLRFVTFQRYVADVPVEGAEITLWFKYGKLIMAGLESHPAASRVSTRAQLDAYDANQLALDLVGTDDARLVGEAELVILPEPGLVGRTTPDYNLVYKVRVDSDAPTPAQYYLYIDAQTGALIHRYNDVRFGFQGTITGAHEVRTVGDEVIYSPMVDADVRTKPWATTQTDQDGFFSLPGRGTQTLTTSMKGVDVTIRSDVAEDPSATFEGTQVGNSDYVWEWGEGSKAAAQVFIQTQIVQDRTRYITPDNVGISGRMIANIDIASSCNAFYNGWSINFFQESDDCNNTGRISDIVFHEYGHHYHYSLVVTGTTNGAIGEGSGDYLSATITNSPVVGPNFIKGGGAVRDLEPNMVYPDDLVGEVHGDGLIWGGAMWDLRKRLIADLGETDGIELSDDLFAKTLMSGPTLATAYEGILVADDDDGDLANGTPHLCEITEEFGLHGLGPGVRPEFVHFDEPVATAGADLNLAVEISSSYDACLNLVDGTAKLLWSTNPEGPFNAVALTSTGDSGFEASIPAQSDGTLVYYTFAIEDSTGVLHSANKGKNFALYQAYFGALEEITCETFEANDGGYTHALIAGEVSDGADDWMWGTPTGGGGDPREAASGHSVWGNDLAPEGYNGLYQSDKVNALYSASYNTEGHSGVILRYRRWLNVEDGSADQATILVNDTPVWQNTATEAGNLHTEDRRWTWHYIPLDGLADDQAALTLTWELATNESGDFGGWTIDDVCLFATE